MVHKVEAQFATRNVTRQLTKFHYVADSLTPEMAADVRDILIRPPEDEPNDTLKEVLTRRTTLSASKRLEQLLSAEELGDRKPTQLLRRMQQLLGDKSPLMDDKLFIQLLPPSIRVVLAKSTPCLSWQIRWLKLLDQQRSFKLFITSPPLPEPLPHHHRMPHIQPCIRKSWSCVKIWLK